MDIDEREFDGFRPGQLDTARDEAANLRIACEQIGAVLANRFGYMEQTEVECFAEGLVEALWRTLPLEQLSDEDVRNAVSIDPHEHAATAMYGAWEAAWAARQLRDVA